MTLTKSEILADESLFQRACAMWVSRNIGECVSSLMSDVGRNLEECSRIFDFDYDEALGWFEQEDWEEAARYFIREADLDDLETIADMVGYWSDVLEEVGAPEGCEADEWVEAHPEKLEELRTRVDDLVTNDAEYREICYHFNLDPERYEIYEHWTIPEGWTARDLEAHGQVIFDFGGLCIWGRATTGQSISMDGVIRNIVRELSDDHYIWSEVR